MNIGFWMCIVLFPVFAVLAVIFGVLKENAVKLIAGFNGLTKAEQEKYDKERIAKDNRNNFIVWSVIMLAGAAGSYLLSQYAAGIAYIMWIILFFKDLHLDVRRAFSKYKIK